ncbi:MarR family winged helix-turn-helix transcriptional regulator [Homoserinimonas sp. A447]
MTANTSTPPRRERLAQGVIGADLSFLLARANAVSLSAANAGLAAHGLRVRSYCVLALACDGARPSQKEIAEFLRLDPSQVVSLIDELAGRGLVERVPDPRDRRFNVLVATDAGLEVHSRARVDIVRAEDTVLSILTADERDALANVLRRLAFANE